MRFRRALLAMATWPACLCDDSGFTTDGEKTAAVSEGGESESESEIDIDIECPAGTTSCARSCCYSVEVCRFGACIPPPVACAGQKDCSDDSCCARGECIPFGVGPCGDFDPSCENPVVISGFAPEVQCTWLWPATTANDTGLFYQVMSTPVVVDFDFDANPATLAPSIVFSSYLSDYYGSGDAVVRVIDGASCAEQFALTEPTNRVNGAASPAVGDLTLDGRAEIVAGYGGGGVVAFTYDASTATFVQLWRSHYADGSPYATAGINDWGGPSIHDLDGVAPPEVVYGAVIIGADGLVLSETLGLHWYMVGQIPVIADVDLDGLADLVYGDGVWGFDPASDTFSLKTTYVGTGLDGFTALGDFGDFGDGPGIPEVVVISPGTARVQRITGEIVFGPVTIPGIGTGGPPTVADFDGDGEPEFAAANGSAYAVFDLECTGAPLPAGCAAEGVRWWQPSQDFSSNVTGSSVFDFDGDGAAEAVYADECYLRVYDGMTGTVKYSTAHTSCTTYENPIIADVDGDFNSEIVTSVNETCSAGLACPAADPLFPSATYALSHGIAVYRDTTDLWVNSRPVWNQHAYAVTHINDDGTVPLLGDITPNWLVPGLNNFRQNATVVGKPTDAPDLTVSGADLDCGGKEKRGLRASVCNRGTQAVASGLPVTFYAGGIAVCTQETSEVLRPGACQTLFCSWKGALTAPTDVRIVADDNGTGVGENTECREGNNTGVIEQASCNGPE